MDVGRLRDWLQQHALPLWATAGVDKTRGGFVESLTLEGEPILGVPKRQRVQARQIYVYSHAHLLGWEGPWLATARHGFEFMSENYWDAEDGGWIFSAERDGTPANTVREAYEQAFALFSLAWFHRASGDDTVLGWIARTLEFLDGRLGDPVDGGYQEAIPNRLPRRQNPHMHLLEAMLALHWATGEPKYTARARQLFELFRSRLFHPATGTLGEFFGGDWQPAPGQTGTLVEPGHHFEWVWLLQQYGRASSDDVSSEQTALYDFAETQGVDTDDGLAFDGVLRDGSTHDDNKRLWVQTEAIKAQIVRAEQGHKGAAARLDQLLDAMFETYLRDNGAWQDHVRRDRTGFAPDAPASSFYHVFLAISDALRFLQGGPASPYPQARHR